MAHTHYLGIDLGTSGVKGLLLNNHGEVIHKSFYGYNIASEQPNFAEQKAEDWLGAISIVCRDLLKNVPIFSIKGVGFSGQLNGFVLLDKEGKLLRNPIIWLDGRAELESMQIAEMLGSSLEQFTYNKTDKIAVLPKLLWIKKNQPELLAKTETILFVKDYVIYQLTHELSTDFSEASCTMLYDFNRHDWNEEVLNFIGVKKEAFPVISPASQVVGFVSVQGEQKTGIPKGVPVVAGAGDVACLTVGSGIYQTGKFGLTLGTGGHMVMVSPAPYKETIGKHWQMQHVRADQYILLGLIQNCGLAINWWRKLLNLQHNLKRKELSFEELSQLAKNAEPQAKGVFFLPFLEGSAPPLPSIQTGGMFYGLSSTHNSSDLTLAVFEGIAFNIKDCANAYQDLGFQIKQISVGEGGSQNEYWLQIIANILNVQLCLLQEIDASALGAALLAMSGAENIPLPEVIEMSIQQDTPNQKVILPNPQWVNLYQEKYHQYQKLITNYAV